MSLKRMLLALALAGASFAAQAVTVYVAKSGNDETGDGSEANPYLTIQKGVEAAKAQGDGNTVIVGPGDYGESDGTRTANDGCLTRVYVTNRMRIMSSEGPEKTRIIGRRSTNANGLGTDAVRCVTFYFGSKSLLKGFTLCDGATQDGNDAPSRGGGLHCHGSGTGVWVKDCVITNCIAKYGDATQGGFLIHCKVLGNHGPRAGSICRQTYLYGCLLRGNTTGNLFEGSAASQCTVVDNSHIGSVTFRNSAFVMNNLSYTPSDEYHSVQDSTDGYLLLRNPLCGDYRPISSGAAATVGSENACNGVISDSTTFEWYGKGQSWWTVEDCPKGLDINGKAFAISGGSCVAGAYSETVDFTPAAEPIAFSGATDVDGVTCIHRGFILPESYPTSYYAKAVLSGSQRLFEYVNWKGGIGYERFPDMDEGIRVMPLPFGEGVLTNSYRLAEMVLWLDPDQGSDANAGTSSDAPLRTLQGIYPKRYGRTLALAKSGTYAEMNLNARESVLWGCSNLANMANMRFRLKSLEGAEKTFIRGRLDESTLGESSIPGAGYAAVRGFTVQFSGQIQGFTISDCASGRTSTASPDDPNLGGANAPIGGVVMASLNSEEGYSAMFSIADCVISNCVASEGTVGNGVMVERCVITNCTAGSTLIRGGFAQRSLFVDNKFTSSADMRSVSNGRVVNCTVIDPSKRIVPTSWSDKSFNTVFLGGSSLRSSAGALAGCVAWDFTTPVTRPGIIWKDPVVTAPDYRVAFCSPAIGAAVLPTKDMFGDDYFRFVSDDLDGTSPSFTLSGAYSSVEPGVLVSAEKGGLALSGCEAGFTPLSQIDEITVTRDDGTRPCVGFVAAGVTNLFDETESVTYTAAEIAAAGGEMSIDALYTTDWYVNADGAVGDDTNTGFTPKTAKRTLKGAMEAEGLASGDTVHAAKGDYDDLAMLRTTPHWTGVVPTVRARAVVPAGVALVGDEGRDVTFITGAGDYETDPTDGLGPNAIRCLQLLDGASVAGFTLRGGRTDSIASATYNDNTTGAGVLGWSASTTWARDCIVTNCVAYHGGGFRLMSADRCKVFECASTDNSGGIGLDVSLYNTFCDYNRSIYLVMAYGNIVNCTFGAHNTRWANPTVAWAMATPASTSSRVRNVLSLIPTASAGIHQRSYFTATMVAGQFEDGAGVTNAAAMKIDADGRPVIGENCGIDAANPEYLTGDRAAADADGGQRVYNGALDLGCFEADWRGMYARDISKSSRFSVSAATPNVVEDATSKTVKIPAGEKLSAAWRGKAGDTYDLTVTLPGSGTLTITSNGTAVATVAGPVTAQTLKLDGVDGILPLEFAYSGDGSYAEILNSRRDCGALLLVR